MEAVDESPVKLYEQKLMVTSNQETEMQTKKVGLYFDWAPNTQSYASHIDDAPKKNNEIKDLIKKVSEGE